MQCLFITEGVIMERVDAVVLAEIVAQVKAGDVVLGGVLDLDKCKFFDPGGRWMNEAYIAQILEEMREEPA